MNENNASSQRVRGLEPEQDAARSLAGSVGGEDKSHASVSVRVERRGIKILDKDNLYGSAKFIVDACKAAGFIPGDDPQSINLEVSQTRVTSKKEIETIVEIIYGKV